MARDAVRSQWQEIEQTIIQQLDIKAEYEKLGLVFSSESPTAKGWLQCHARDRADNNPSAAVNVGSTSLRGRYRDQGGNGESHSLFNFAAKYGHYRDWRAAREHYAKQLKVSLPKTKDASSLDHLDISPKSGISDFTSYSKAKQGVTFESLIMAGAKPASWPNFTREPNAVIAFPGYDHRGLDSDPAAYHIVNREAKLIKVERKGKPPTFSKTKQIGPSVVLYNLWAMQHWATASVVWVVEGVSDMLALQVKLGRRTDHVVVTAGGCQVRPGTGWPEKFAGKEVRICFDHDREDKKGRRPGQEGAVVWAAELSPHADKVRNILLPVEGTDLREYLLECTYQDLCDLAETVEPVKAKGMRGALAEMLPKDLMANGVLVGEDKEAALVPLAIDTIRERLLEKTGGWPRQAGETLFVDSNSASDADSRIWFLKDVSTLFAYIHQQFPGNLQWFSQSVASTPATKGEFHSHLLSNCERYRSIESYPHYPEIPKFYYSTPMLPAANGTALESFLDFFNPKTDVDRDLLKAAVMTQFWGGPFGMRPVFLFRSSQGAGSGKTVTAQAIASLTGGVFDCHRDEQVDKIKGRLLSSGSSGKRICLLDNVKASRFSWADFESLVTAKEISGHKMYTGEASVPNSFTWMITMNGPNLSSDISQRVVVIDLVRPEYDSSWGVRLDRFVNENRWRIIADIKEVFENDPEVPHDSNLSRWAGWDLEVLGRAAAEINEALQVLAERRRETNADANEADMLLDFLKERINPCNYPENERIHIPVALMAKWYNECEGGNTPAKKVTVRLKDLFDAGTQPWLEPNPARHNGRGFIFQPYLNGGIVNYDLEKRLRLSGGIEF